MRCILAIILTLSSFWLSASHIIGGNLEVQQVGRNRFYVELIIFRDCRTPSNPNEPKPVELANKLNIMAFARPSLDTLADFFVFKKPPLLVPLGDDCFEPPNLCVEEYRLSDTITLPDNPGGYIIAMQICCRNTIIDNIISPGSTGMTLTAEIPDPALAGGNSTPQLPPFPTDGFFCALNTRSIDFSATDPDGDSLHYELVNPLTSPAQNPPNPPPTLQPPPYSPINWLAGYSASYPIPGNPGLSIDPQSGRISISPTKLGLFVFAFKVSEYRNGVYLGSVQRDVQVEILNCTINQEPKFREPLQDSLRAKVSRELCVQVVANDPNPEDTMQLLSSYRSLPTADSSGRDIDLTFEMDTGTVSGQVCYTPSCSETFKGEKVEFKFLIYSQGCDGVDTAEQKLIIDIEPLPQRLDDLIPNVFTPNNDGFNDVFKLTDQEVYPCIEELEVRVYNRWGTLVYENPLNDPLGWDGNFNGEPVAPGVYFFTVSTRYNSSDFNYKSFLTLNR